MLSSAGLEPGA